jgi:hypothetical protein
MTPLLPELAPSPILGRGLENEHITPPGRQSSSNRAAYDATTNDHYVGLFHGSQFIRIVVPVANFALKKCARLHQKPLKTRTARSW